MRAILSILVGTVLAASAAFAQGGYGRLGGSAGAVGGGVFRSGGMGTVAGSGGGGLALAPSPLGGFGSSLLPPPVSPALPRAGYGRRGGYGGGYAGGFYGGVAYFDGFYRSVHNPPPGVYDPIFGVYNPGVLAAAPSYATESAVTQPIPSVVINQNFQSDVAHPQFRDYTNVPLPEPGGDRQSGFSAQPAPPNAVAPAEATQAPAPRPGEQQIYFLIVLTDSTVETAVAYWITGETLHFINLQGRQDSVPLGQVDRAFSRRLNQGRRIAFDLP